MFLKSFSKALPVLILALSASQFASADQGSFGRGEFGRGGFEAGRGPDRGDRDQADRRSARQIVRVLYRGILFREGDQAGVQYYADLVQQRGMRGVVEAAGSMAESPEYRQNVDSRYRPNQILNNVYAEFFSRRVDRSGQESYLPLLRQGRAGEVMRAIAGSEEFRRRYMR